MTLFDLDISEKELAGSQHITAMGRRLIAAFLHKMKTEKLTKAELANRLGVDKALVSRLLRGDANMTLRTEGELYWAMGYEPANRYGDHRAYVIVGNGQPLPMRMVEVTAEPRTVVLQSKPKIAVAIQ